MAKKEFGLKAQEAIFVDDNPKILEVAEKYALIPILMDRNMTNSDCKYQIISSLFEI